MVAVTLYFAPYTGTDAIGLQIEEAPDSTGPWTQLVNTSDIGTAPDWISSYTVQATSIDHWFRLRWQLEGSNPDVFTEWSDPVLGSALPYHWTVPDLYKSVSQHKLSAWSAPQIQLVIDRAYYMLQEECGPYDETAEGFADVAQMVIHVLMDRILPTMSRGGASIGAGMQEEEMGSYRYRRALSEAIAMSTAALAIPSDLKALICPFGVGSDDFPVSSTHVFLQTPYVLEGTNGRERVFTSDDRHGLAPGVSPWPWWNNWGAYAHSLGE